MVGRCVTRCKFLQVRSQLVSNMVEMSLLLHPHTQVMAIDLGIYCWEQWRKQVLLRFVIMAAARPPSFPAAIIGSCILEICGKRSSMGLSHKPASFIHYPEFPNLFCSDWLWFGYVDIPPPLLITANKS